MPSLQWANASRNVRAMKWFLRIRRAITETLYDAPETKDQDRPVDSGWDDEARKKLEENNRFLKGEGISKGGKTDGNDSKT